MTGALLPITVVLLLVLTRPLSLLFHELGHGILALLLTKEKVTIYLGSYGDTKKSLNFRLGRLEFFFKFNPLMWNAGLCVPHSKNISINRWILIVAFGPLTSLVLAVLCSYIVFGTDINGGIGLVCILFLGISSIDFFLNIIPKGTPTQLYNGSFVFNDGQQLVMLFRYKYLPSQYRAGAEYFNNGAYEEAAQYFQKIAGNGLKNDLVYRLGIATYLQLKDFNAAIAIHYDFERHCKLNADDYLHAGYLKLKLESFHEGILDLQKSLSMNPKNKYSLNNKGYAHLILEQYDEALADFDKAIQFDPKFAYAFNNRGFAKMKLGKPEEGLKDIAFSLELDEMNAYSHRNLGIYHFEKNDFVKALECFEKTFELDAETELIEEYLIKTREKLEENSQKDA